MNAIPSSECLEPTPLAVHLANAQTAILMLQNSGHSAHAQHVAGLVTEVLHLHATIRRLVDLYIIDDFHPGADKQAALDAAVAAELQRDW